jgi:hypothetical protein
MKKSKESRQLGAAMLTAEVRYSFTAQYLHAAALFVRRAYEIELDSVHTGAQETEHRGCVVAAVMQSVAALETEIDEIVIYGPGHHLGGNSIDHQARSFMGPLQELIDAEDVLGRYELVLHLTKKKTLPRGTAVHENAVLLVRLRNALVHYKSRWGGDSHKKLIVGLKKLALPRPPFVSEGHLFFPHQCLSAAQGSWAVRTSLDFLRNFYVELGYPPPVSHIETDVAMLLTPPNAQGT